MSHRGLPGRSLRSRHAGRTNSSSSTARPGSPPDLQPESSTCTSQPQHPSIRSSRHSGALPPPWTSGPRATSRPRRHGGSKLPFRIRPALPQGIDIALTARWASAASPDKALHLGPRNYRRDRLRPSTPCRTLGCQWSHERFRITSRPGGRPGLRPAARVAFCGNARLTQGGRRHRSGGPLAPLPRRGWRRSQRATSNCTTYHERRSGVCRASATRDANVAGRLALRLRWPVMALAAVGRSRLPGPEARADRRGAAAADPALVGLATASPSRSRPERRGRSLAVVQLSSVDREHHAFIGNSSAAEALEQALHLVDESCHPRGRSPRVGFPGKAHDRVTLYMAARAAKAASRARRSARGDGLGRRLMRDLRARYARTRGFFARRPRKGVGRGQLPPPRKSWARLREGLAFWAAARRCSGEAFPSIGVVPNHQGGKSSAPSAAAAAGERTTSVAAARRGRRV